MMSQSSTDYLFELELAKLARDNEPPPAHSYLHSRADLKTPASEHADLIPQTVKAKSRRLASMIANMPISRVHRNNAPLTPLAAAPNKAFFLRASVE